VSAVVDASVLVAATVDAGAEGSWAERVLAQKDLCTLELSLVPFEAFAERVWQLRRNVSSYDAWYVAVAEALDLPLATLDRRLSRAPGPSCRFWLPPRP